MGYERKSVPAKVTYC